MVHAEHPTFIRGAPSGERGDYTAYLASRPAIAEQAAIEMLLRLAAWCPVPLHIVHLSSALGLQTIRAARQRGQRITAETCPHYLTWVSSDIPDGATEYKCAPPIRDTTDREALWGALVAGAIDMIVSDHSPCPSAMKASGGDFFKAWGGITSLQLGLSAVWTAARERGLSPAHVARWMCAAPARLVGLNERKGRIVAGCDAELVVWDPEAEFVVNPARLEHRHPITPYAGCRLRGVVKATFVGGRLAFRDGAFPDPCGALLVP